MSNKLQGWLAPNTLTEDTNDRILVLNSAGTVDNEQLYEDMREEDTGLRRETLVHVVTLYERMVARALMNGHNVNTGLFYAVPRFIGPVEDGHITPGRNFRITGSRIRIEGTDENVGISFRSLTDDTVTKVTPDMFGTNNPSELIFIAPTGLADGEYEMTLTTQYSGNTQRFLKTARSVSRIVYVGTNKGEEGEDDRPVIE